jgi:vancomycin resistance protein YoaR
MKNALFYTTVFVLVTISGVLTYYIFANTYRTDQPLFNFQATDSIYETITTEFQGTSYVMSAKYIPEEEVAASYGRGADIGKVLSEAVGIIAGPDEKKFYVLDIEYFLENLNLPYKISTNNSVYIDNEKYLRNCESNTYNLQFNQKKIEEDIREGTSSINLDKYIVNPETFSLIEKCNEYNTEKTKLASVISTYFKNTDLSKYFKYSTVTKHFEIESEATITDALSDLREDFSKETIDPQYEEVDNSIYLLSYYENGYDVDVSQTLINLTNFISGKSTGFNIETFAIEPEIFSTNKKIYDFSNLISEGKSRMELIRNGFTNWVIQFADFGLYEVHNHIIQPGEEFSFLSTISPSNGLTKSGFPIDGGICNATTTIFRAALEAGLPITDRSYHYKNVPSYDWPYKMNIVDSAYFTTPKVDLKFVNDTKYPILMRFEKSQRDGYQYQTIKMYSDKNYTNREVELTNWKKWNEFSPTHFEASFDRIVYENGKKIREDNFYSRYLD